jgi:uncharacterized ubiquitin-like protein YukD
MSLVICLTMSLSLHSQILSSDSLVCVPRTAVEKALTLKSKYDLTIMELTTTRELVQFQEEKLRLQSDQLSNYSVALQSKDNVIVEKDNIIALRDEQIKSLKRERKAKFWNGILFGGAGGATLIAVLFVL